MVQNATVVMEVEKPPELDMKEIMDKVKAQYEAMATRARDNTEQFNQQNVSIAFVSTLPFFYTPDHFSPALKNIMPSILTWEPYPLIKCTDRLCRTPLLYACGLSVLRWRL